MVRLTGLRPAGRTSNSNGNAAAPLVEHGLDMSSVYGFSSWESFYLPQGARRVAAVDVEDNEEMFELTSEEKYDNALWRMRVEDDEVYSRTYVPIEWKKKEMDAIIEFLALKYPRNHRDYLNLPVQQGTKDAISSIFYPQQGELRPVLLKRGPVRVRGDVRELMLFTNGFLLSTVDVDALVSLLLDDGSSEKKIEEESNPEEPPSGSFRRFSLIDTDGNGSLDRSEVRSSFIGMRMPLDESVLDEVITKFDTDSDGKISFEEFKSMMPVKGAFWGGLGGKLKDVFSRDRVTRKLDVAFQLSDIDGIENTGAHQIEQTEPIAHPELALFDFAVHVQGVSEPLTLMCSKPGHAQAWVEAFQTCIASNKSNSAGGNDPGVEEGGDFKRDTMEEKTAPIKSGRHVVDWGDSRIDWGD